VNDDSDSDFAKLIETVRARHAGHTSKRIPLDLAIKQGHDLIALKAACRHGEFRKLIENRLPFGYAVVSDLMKIAPDNRPVAGPSEKCSPEEHFAKTCPNSASTIVSSRTAEPSCAIRSRGT